MTRNDYQKTPLSGSFLERSGPHLNHLKYLLLFVEVIAYCLISTHYHLLVRVIDLKDQISKVSVKNSRAKCAQKLKVPLFELRNSCE